MSDETKPVRDWIKVMNRYSTKNIVAAWSDAEFLKEQLKHARLSKSVQAIIEERIRELEKKKVGVT